jgi:hypothetical protein
MKCPHCLVAMHDQGTPVQVVQFSQSKNRNGQTVASRLWLAFHQRCPECQGDIIEMEGRPASPGSPAVAKFMAFPKAATRPVPAEVPDPYRSDFEEACAVLTLSPKASAALSRRCLQSILRDKAKTTKKDLYDQIEEVVASGTAPSHIADDLHAVRNIGNFAAHPAKSTTSGAILDVEPGEAEWNLDVLESLFDYYFVQPALSAKRKTELNKKLQEAGKPLIK